jgi:hypothetical protein
MLKITASPGEPHFNETNIKTYIPQISYTILASKPEFTKIFLLRNTNEKQ